MDTSNSFIRNAAAEDISRIAEILVFSKRTHYRSIFQDDAFSFGKLQVLPIAQSFLKAPDKLRHYWVYDDGLVKGFIHLEGAKIAELYVDPFFERQHVGAELVNFAFTKIMNPFLWVVEGNDNAVQFYQSQGFILNGERRLVENSDKYELRMVSRRPETEYLRKTLRVVIDRPVGTPHPDFPDTVYPVNYGYVDGIPGGDGEYQDAYVLGLKEPVKEVTGRVFAVIHRLDDNEDKWVVAPVGVRVLTSDVSRWTAFQEKHFKSQIFIV